MTKIKIVTRLSALAVAAVAMNGAMVQFSAAQLPALPQPEFSMRDENGVDLLSFNAYSQVADASIGAKEHPLGHTIYSGPSVPPPSGAYDSFYGYVQWPLGSNYATCSPTQPVYVLVVFGNSRESFYGCHTFTATGLAGSALGYNSANGTYSYTRKDGTIIVYSGVSTANQAVMQQILYPDGRVLTYAYCADGPGTTYLCSATRSDGLQVKYRWTLSSGVWSLTNVVLINNAYEYCNPTASTCTLQKTWPTASYSSTSSVFTVTDAAGRITTYTSYGNGTLGVKLPSSTGADNLVYTFCGSSNCPQYAFEAQFGVQYQGYVLSVVRDGQTWSYSGNPSSPTQNQCAGVRSIPPATYGFTNPVGNGKHVTLLNCLPNTPTALQPGNSPLLQLTNEDGVQFNAGLQGVQIVSAVYPEGNQTNYTWDSASNLTQEKRVPKSGSALTPVTLSANYNWTGCTAVNCNEPNFLKDGNQNETDYTYDPTHGGMLTKTSPAALAGTPQTSVRAQTTYTYTRRYAWVLNSSSTYVKSAAPIWVLATETICRTSTATPNGSNPCSAPGDQVVKTYQYGPNSGPNNLFLRGVSVAADGVTHTTCYGYDIYGNRSSETEPLAGLTTCP